MLPRRTEPRPAGTGDRRTQTESRRALVRFTAGCLVALVAVGVASVVVADNLAETAMLHEALIFSRFAKLG